MKSPIAFSRLIIILYYVRGQNDFFVKNTQRHLHFAPESSKSVCIRQREILIAAKDEDIFLNVHAKVRTRKGNSVNTRNSKSKVIFLDVHVKVRTENGHISNTQSETFRHFCNTIKTEARNGVAIQDLQQSQ